MQDRSLKGAGQEYGRGRAEAGAGKEQGKSRAGAGKDHESIEVGVVHIPNFTQIILDIEFKKICYWPALIGWSSRSTNSHSNSKLIPCCF